jgi:hypothetical protein
VEASCLEDEGLATFTQDRSTPMTDEVMSPLRRRMIEDMTIRKLAPKTQQLHPHDQGFGSFHRTIA